MRQNSLKILVIDNNVNLHEFYLNFFNACPNYELIGISDSVTSAIKQCKKNRPDVIFSEVNFKDGNGIDAIETYIDIAPAVKVIMISEITDIKLIKKAFENSASGYLTKPLTDKKLYNALESIEESGATISHDITQKLIASFRRKTNALFSKRENQVVEFLKQGATYKIIAQKLFVSHSAVNFHVQNIYLKLDVNSKSAALLKLQQLEYASA